MLTLPKSDYVVRTSKKTGRGIFATRDIEPGVVVGDYIGKIIKPDSSDENKNGLYDMRGGLRYDILANPKKEGIHWINHSCANNSDAYPYRGHILYVTMRKVFKGEEITANYGLGEADEKDIVCSKHVCNCGSRICTGTMHEEALCYEAWCTAWEKLLKREFKEWYRKLPGKYGDQLKPLDAYPASIKLDDPRVYPHIFGSEIKTPLRLTNATIPSLGEIKNLISRSGRQLSFPKMHLTIYGIRNEFIIGERKG